LEGTTLNGAQLTGADLSITHLEGATINDAQLASANLNSAHLAGATLNSAHLAGATLTYAHLEGATLNGAHLEGADLRLASFSAETVCNNITLTDAAHGSVLLADLRWGGVNLSVVDWEPLRRLGDEALARQQRVPDSGRKLRRSERRDGYKAAVRANRQLAVMLQTQGLSEDAARFAYRAQVLQRRVYRLQGIRKLGAYLFSLLLAVLAGYGYRLWRILLAYVLALTLFATAYFVAGTWLGGNHLEWYEALLVSLTAIHGRVFITSFGLDSIQSWVAAAESVVGIVIEGVFVAMLIQRFFGR
jgi:hypothetical protein